MMRGSTGLGTASALHKMVASCGHTLSLVKPSVGCSAELLIVSKRIVMQCVSCSGGQSHSACWLRTNVDHCVFAKSLLRPQSVRLQKCFKQQIFGSTSYALVRSIRKLREHAAELNAPGILNVVCRTQRITWRNICCPDRAALC